MTVAWLLFLMKGYKCCGKDDSDCECCMMVKEILEDTEVQQYFKSDEFKNAKLPVATAMSDNFKGWCNFALHELGLKTNVCHPHASGNELSMF